MKRKQFDTKIFITVVIFLVAMIPGTIASMLYFHTERNSIMKQAGDYEIQIMSELLNDFSELEDQLEKIQYEVTSQFVMMKMDKIDFVDLKEGEVEKIHILENLLQSMKRTYRGVSNIYVIGRQDMDIVYGSTLQFNKKWLLENEWLNQEYYSSKQWEIIPDHEISYHSSSGKDRYTMRCFSFVVGLVNKDNNDAFEYLLQIDIDTEHIYSLIDKIQVNKKSSVGVYTSSAELSELRNLNEEDQMVFDAELKKQRPDMGEILIHQEGDLLFSKTRIPEIDMFVYKSSRPLEELGIDYLYRQILLLILFSFLVAALAATIITSSFMKPFEKLIKSTMMSVEHVTELPAVSIKSGSSLIMEMEEQFNLLITRVNSLMQSTLKQENEKQDLQMKMLQAQINPHFMYNTLNSIKWMALMRRQPEIAETITALVDLLEYCCRDTEKLVSLEEEIEFLKNYIQIQKMRNQDCKIDVIFDIAENTKKLKIIKLSLQPSVENAFVHAFPDMKEDAKIEVITYCEDKRLYLLVKDNGSGFDTEIVKKNMTGIGIENVDNRIKLTYGDTYGQRIDSRIGQGTIVTIELPVQSGTCEKEEHHETCIAGR